MSQAVYEPLDQVRQGAHVDSLEKYKEMHEQSLKDPEVRWVLWGPPQGRADGLSLDESPPAWWRPRRPACRPSGARTRW